MTKFSPYNKQRELEALSEICNKILQKYERLPLMALSWMHFTNSRESVHRILLDRKNFPERFVLVLVRIPFLVLYSIYLFCLIFFIRCLNWNVLRQLHQEKIDLIARTWFFQRRPQNGEEDFYLGNLPKLLEEEGVSSLLLYGNVSGNHWYAFAKVLKSVHAPYPFPDLALVSPWRVFQSVFLQIGTAFRVLFCRPKDEDIRMQRVRQRAAVDSLRCHVLMNSLQYWIGKKAAALWKPKGALTLYEGHGWEKCFWAGVKSAYASCKTIGYQHTVILPRTFSLKKPFFGLTKFSPPDVVLSIGRQNIAVLKKEIQGKVTFIPFGSFRVGRVLKAKGPNPRRKNVLVLPEGVPVEAKLLFQSALDLARRMPETRFILRCHPALPFEKVAPLLDKNVSHCPNVEISRFAGIEDDFKRASVILYRGSSAVLYAVAAGLKPFYLNVTGSDWVDPLAELSSFKERVASVDMLQKRLELYFSTKQEELRFDWEKALEFVRDFTGPVRRESIHLLKELMRS